MNEHIDYLSTLFVGIDIASRVHVISALDFDENFYIKIKPVENTQEVAVLMKQMISDVSKHNLQFKYLIIGMEAINFYGVHLANYLSGSGAAHTAFRVAARQIYLYFSRQQLFESFSGSDCQCIHQI